MYGAMGSAAVGGAGVTGVLASTGAFDGLAGLVATTTLLAAGLALFKLAHRRRSS
ncbi:hypothetical protein ACIQCF_33320 [Streptomyces sp. NPDC088353]|uniref:hypothetical protein n=1 Tax=Streptomyces sp. NPDC088353 TaxID=3365855 RepID=UPI003803DA33